METSPVHVRLRTDDLAELKSLSTQCETNPTAMAAYVIRAFIRAAKAHDKRITLPPHFQIIEDPAADRRMNNSPANLKTKARQ